MVNAGIASSAAFDTLSRQVGSAGFRNALRRISAALSGGETISAAMERERKFFSPLEIGIIRAGEAGGRLDKLLKDLADITEENQKIQPQGEFTQRYSAQKGIGEEASSLHFPISPILTLKARINDSTIMIQVTSSTTANAAPRGQLPPELNH